MIGWYKSLYNNQDLKNYFLFLILKINSFI